MSVLVTTFLVSGRGFKSKKELYGIVNDCPMAAGEALARNLIDGKKNNYKVLASRGTLELFFMVCILYIARIAYVSHFRDLCHDFGVVIEIFLPS